MTAMQENLDLESISSASVPGKKYIPRIENGEWICDGPDGPCEHFRYRHTDCRHILEAKLNVEHRPKEDGVRPTSLEAYIELINDPEMLNKRYQEILVALWEQGIPSTDREITTYLGREDPNYVRPRRNELADPEHFYRPLVQEISKRECLISGKTAYAWFLTKEGDMLVESFIGVENEKRREQLQLAREEITGNSNRKTHGEI